MGNLCAAEMITVSTETVQIENPGIQSLCVRNAVYGSKQEGPFWESEILLEKVRFGGLEMEFFKALALCNECKVVEATPPSSENGGNIRMNYTEEKCVLIAKNQGIELSDFLQSKRKIVKYNTEKYPKRGRKEEHWAELLVLGESVGRRRTTIALQRMSKRENTKKGNIYVFSHGNRSNILEILKEEIIEDPTIAATKTYFEDMEDYLQLERESQETNDDEMEECEQIPLVEYYIAHKIIDLSEWEEMEEELSKGEGKGDKLEAFHSEVERDMTLLGCIAIPPNG